jgi:hypothetical protein
MSKQKTGVPTLMQVSKRMCDAVSRFTPAIYRHYSTNAALLAALAAAQAACAVLQAELAKERDYGD